MSVSRHSNTRALKRDQIEPHSLNIGDGASVFGRDLYEPDVAGIHPVAVQPLIQDPAPSDKRCKLRPSEITDLTPNQTGEAAIELEPKERRHTANVATLVRNLRSAEASLVRRRN